MKNFRYQFVTFVILFCSVLGCSLAGRIKKEVEKSQTPQVFTSTDNICQVTVPGNWKNLPELHEDAIIKAGNLFGEQYLIIIRENKEDFGKNFTLDNITEISRDNFKSAATDTFLSEPISVKINGYPAKQFETSGEVENLKVKYIYSIVETPNNYYQIIAWTLNSKYDQNKSIFLDVMNSFKETGDNNPVLPPSKSKSNSKK